MFGCLRACVRGCLVAWLDWIASSLWRVLRGKMLDMEARIDRRTFLAAAGATLPVLTLAQEVDDAPRLTHGPFVCPFDAEHAAIWARVSQPGTYTIELENGPPFGDPLGPKRRVRSAAVAASADSDLTVRWVIDPLACDSSVSTLRVRRDEALVHSFETRFSSVEALRSSFTQGLCGYSPPPRGTTVVLGSCADEQRFPVQPVWDAMGKLAPDLVVMLGDTPYIESTDLAVQRRRYREFYEQPQLAALLRAHPFVGTWDDHDYASNDRFGAVEGRENSRRAFLEYHGPGEWGLDGQGIFTKRRVGAIEVFLLDTRWFADTEPCPFDASKKTLLGAVQLRWLQEGLKASTAPFKVLACGMIWNDAARPGKVDFWGHWAHERDALFAWLGREKIGGVVLVGGDIHRTRVVEHKTKEVVGYDLLELITTPIANTVIESNNAPHPGLLFDKGVEQAFLSLTARPEALTARMIDGSGATMYEIERTAHWLSDRR